MNFTVEAADLSKPEVLKQFSEWIQGTKDNLFDAKVLFYPTTNVIVVKDGNGDPLLFAPFQATMTLESLAVRPGISAMGEAVSLLKLYEGIERICMATGVREVWFNCNDDRFIKFLTGLKKDRKFEIVKSTVLRRKIRGPEIPKIECK